MQNHLQKSIVKITVITLRVVFRIVVDINRVHKVIKEMYNEHDQKK